MFSDEKTVVIDKKLGDVTGDGFLDIVYLTGEKPNDESSPFISNIKIIIQDGKSKIMHIIEFVNNAGYNPNLFLGPFMNKAIDDIFVSIDSGGSGGFGFYYLYSFNDSKEKLLFDVDKFNNTFRYQVTYKNYYKVEIINTTFNKIFVLDIANKDKQYLNNLYESNGVLKKPISGYVLPLNNLYAVDITGDGVYDLYALNRVIGLYGADTLGNIETPLYWSNDSFKPIGNMQYISIPSQDLK